MVVNNIMLSDLLKVILEDKGVVECVTNGADALERINRMYYAVIIADMYMPVIDGIKFYNQAVAKYPDLKERFLFFVDYLNPEVASFLKENKIRYITKPATITEIKREVMSILLRE